jgi:hypothetical protein
MPGCHGIRSRFSLIFFTCSPRALPGSMVSPDSMRLFLFNLGMAAISPFARAADGMLTACWAALLAYLLRRRACARKAWICPGVLDRRARISKYASGARPAHLPLCAVAVLMFLLPRQWGSYWNYIIGTVGIYVILGLGLNIIVGFGRAAGAGLCGLLCHWRLHLPPC